MDIRFCSHFMVQKHHQQNIFRSFNNVNRKTTSNCEYSHNKQFSAKMSLIRLSIKVATCWRKGPCSGNIVFNYWKPRGWQGERVVGGGDVNHLTSLSPWPGLPAKVTNGLNSIFNIIDVWGYSKQIAHCGASLFEV